MFASLLAPLDAWLNRVTMYRLVIAYLAALLGIAAAQSARGVLDYPPASIVGTTAVALVSCVAINSLFAETFGAPVNHDSAVITGLILALIVGPAQTPDDYVFLAWAATLAMASKYILAWRNVHLFNPAAIALVATGLFAGQTASWWVGTASLTPFVIGGGLLLTRRIRRGDLVGAFLWATMFVTLAWSALAGLPAAQALQRGVVDSPLWFLGFAMLTEPVTTPPTRLRQLAYGLLAGALCVPQLHVGGFYFTPELALVVANAGALPLRSWHKRRLRLAQAIPVGPGLIDFLYAPSRPLAYQPGQYMEWTLEHDRPDSRGQRRYFTLASSPTERSLRIGVKFAEHGSTFKRALAAHAWRGESIVAAQIAGDFTLPRDPRRKLAFIAGGIGITPFRSMVKYLTDRHEKRDVVLLYANRRCEEILYRDVFTAAQRAFRFRPVYLLSDPSSAPPAWAGAVGRIDAALIARQIPDYRERLFYVSGSPALVQSAQRALRDLGVKPDRIKTDYFSGLAA
ncbi:MAG TPA: RnfABCDGE type electron transport complex subunit D [Thermomicrobiales bacterium]|nr:RnfABCDGE type electron transport complex subunit D [Thermomicrobiales bacterium]